jgi:hypothetical protein
MRKPMVWTGAAAILVGAGSRVMGFAFGKAIAFTYAVIVSVVANVVFDFVRDPPLTAQPESSAAAMVASTDGAAARAVLPASSRSQATAAAVAPAEAPSAAAPTAASPAPQPESARPGPGSGGLY